ncbi:hypothetical protein HK405_011470 [Cladochytrium tenue]|nr:hypothetical protein HK405_011470 [Cladochytrium tenue]
MSFSSITFPLWLTRSRIVADNLCRVRPDGLVVARAQDDSAVEDHAASTVLLPATLRDQPAWNTLVQAHSTFGCAYDAESAFANMLCVGVAPDVLRSASCWPPSQAAPPSLLPPSFRPR